MLIYRCSICNRIFGFSSPLALPKRRWYRGKSVYAGKDYHPNRSPVKKTNEQKGKISYNGLWNFVKALGIIRGTGGTVNICAKVH